MKSRSVRLSTSAPRFPGTSRATWNVPGSSAVFALEHGQIPLAPHLMFPQFVNDEDPEERNLALFMDIVLQGKCQELWVLGDVISEGMSVEIETAKRRRQPVRYFNAEFEEVESL